DFPRGPILRSSGKHFLSSACLLLAGTRESRSSSNACRHVMREQWFHKGGSMKHKSVLSVGVFLFAVLILLDESSLFAGEGLELSKDDRKVDDQAQATIDLGRQIFRFDTFGDEAWWGDTLKLHQAIAGARNGGVGPGVSPKTALAVGLKVDAVKAVLNSWGPGRFDAELDKDGKALRPDGGQAGTLIPPAFGLAGVNLHTWTGFGSVPYWNAYVAVTEMHGSGTFFDQRLSDPVQYPVSARSGSWNTRGTPDLVTAKLPALHAYQLALKAPKPPVGSFDAAAAERGKEVFDNQGRCATCHVPPLYTEPGHNLHTPAEMGVDSFQADRSPTRMYRTAPLAGLRTHQKGGFFHDGRFATLREVIEHYDRNFALGLNEQEKGDLIEYLKSL